MATRDDNQTYMTAREVLTFLGIRSQTLYAYVSRGFIRRVRQSEKKTNLYFREDVERLKARVAARSGLGAIAATAMQFGEPIVPTSITEITVDGPRYRGQLAVELARRNTPFESVAELLWNGHIPDGDMRWKTGIVKPEVRRLCGPIGQVAKREQFMEVFALLTLTIGITRGDVVQRRTNGNTLGAAREILQTLVACMGYLAIEPRFTAGRSGDSVAQGVLRALGGAVDDDNLRTVQAILVLLADHELAPGSFAARVAASSGASLQGCLVAAMCTHAGLKVGRVYDDAQAFLASSRSRGALRKRVEECQRLGREIPGFTHRLYPKGDPRALHLLHLATARPGKSVRFREFLAFVTAAQAELGLHPTIELIVVAFCNEMGLPPQSGGAIFALSRSAGWVAHILEQRLSTVLLRPRAKFVAT